MTNNPSGGEVEPITSEERSECRVAAALAVIRGGE